MTIKYVKQIFNYLRFSFIKERRNHMTIQELEYKVWVQDNIRIVVRGALNTKIGDYSQKKSAQGNWSVTEFIKKRLEPILNGHEVMVLMGDGEQPHGGTLLSSVRPSYKNRS